MSGPERKPEDPLRLRQAFRDHMTRERLKFTRQRELIVELFSRVEGHVSVEELLTRARAADPSIGYATVYRTLKLLVDAGLASARNFGEGFSRFEPLGEGHHDHLLCETCGRIVEFHDEQIEARQETLARDLGFELTHHRHELYGRCPECTARQGLVEEPPESERGDPRELPAAFRDFLGREGLKNTRQRELISELFADVEDHVSVEDLLDRVRERDASIGYATVYRTLKLLVESGLAACRHFGDGFTRFEPRQAEHHDHLIDERSGEVIEFHDELLERRQEEIAAEHGFQLVRHRHDLFGLPLRDGSDRKRR